LRFQRPVSKELILWLVSRTQFQELDSQKVIFEADLWEHIVSQIVAWDHSLRALSSRKPDLLVGLAYACFGASSVFLDFLRNGLRILSITCVENWSSKL